MNIRSIQSIEDDKLSRKSSIYQHSNLLSVMKRGEWCPIVFDKLDGVECGKIKSHKVALKIRPGIDYTFPVGTCEYAKDTYYLTQKDEIEVKKLSAFYGDGFYETHERKNMITNIGKGSLGLHQEKVLRVGKDYVVANKILKAVE